MGAVEQYSSNSTQKFSFYVFSFILFWSVFMKRFTTMVVLCLFAVLLLRPQTAFAGKDKSLDEIRALTCAALKGTGNLGV